MQPPGLWFGRTGPGRAEAVPDSAWAGTLPGEGTTEGTCGIWPREGYGRRSGNRKQHCAKAAGVSPPSPAVVSGGRLQTHHPPSPKEAPTAPRPHPGPRRGVSPHHSGLHTFSGTWHQWPLQTPRTFIGHLLCTLLVQAGEQDRVSTLTLSTFHHIIRYVITFVNICQRSHVNKLIYIYPIFGGKEQ